jgi:hypothetical protein
MEKASFEEVGQFGAFKIGTESREGIRIARGLFLDELPGAAFAAVTLIWIASSLATLMWRETPMDAINHLHILVRAFLNSNAVSMISRLAGAGSFAKSAYGFFEPRNPA